MDAWALYTVHTLQELFKHIASVTVFISLIIDSHFAGLQLIYHILDHCGKDSRSLWKAFVSSSVVIPLKIRLSSAKGFKCVCVENFSPMSFIWIEKTKESQHYTLRRTKSDPAGITPLSLKSYLLPSATQAIFKIIHKFLLIGVYSRSLSAFGWVFVVAL